MYSRIVSSSSQTPQRTARTSALCGRSLADCVARKKFMAVFAGIVDAAASHFNRDDIERRMVVGASGLFVYLRSPYLRSYGLM